MGHVFGIDLGTTYSCISYVDEFGKAVVLKNSDGNHTTPSVVMVESEDNIIVGSEAKRSCEEYPDKTVQFIKRKMGKENDTVVLNGTTYHAPEISSIILKKLVNDANNELKQTGIIKEGEEVRDVVITCPAYFGMNERQATKTAGELAGLNVLNIINEPTAAAISYGVSGEDKDETVLVYDLGGGTFDITVMRIHGGDIKVICTGGDDKLGGKDWDEALISYVVGKYEEEFGEDITEDPETMASLYIDVETWKKSLTSREKVNISVNGPEGRLREELTRERYEEITKDCLTRTKNLLNDTLATAEKQGYPIAKIDKILLVGGSSRMPQVSAMLERDYHVMPVLTDPDESVSKGAAIYAANEKAYNDFVESEAEKAGKSVDEIKEENIATGEVDKKFAISGASGAGGLRLNITNVLSRTYGIEIYGDNRPQIFNMLMINDELPATHTEQFTTRSDNQSSVDINLYESRTTDETIEIEGREPVTSINMAFTSAVPQGTPVIVTLALDNSGLLHILAEETLNHSKLDTIFHLSNQMSEDDINNASLRMAKASIE